MLCPDDGLAEDSYLDSLRRRIVRERVPFSVTLELTRRCNLRCVHCYLGTAAARRDERPEMPTSRWLSLLDEIADLGCLFVLFTGGEPLLRNDFPEIYRKAKMNGMIVTVFTNGTTITDSILDLFSELPPRAVEISIYGASPGTYRAITGKSTGFRTCLETIEKLLRRKVNLRLKTMLLDRNSAELAEIGAIAESFGVTFRFDPMVTPRLDGDPTPLDFRAPVAEIIGKELGSQEERAAWRRGLESVEWGPQGEFLYDCGAGQNIFYVSAMGFMHPCVATTHVSYDLLNGDAKTGWSTIAKIREEKIPTGFVCADCRDRKLCSYCPSAAVSEHEAKRLSFYCSLAQERRKVLELDVEAKSV